MKSVPIFKYMSASSLLIEPDKLKLIYFVINEQRRIEIFPETKESFFVEDVAGLIRFEFDEQGNVIRFIQQRANGNELIGVKTQE